MKTLLLGALVMGLAVAGNATAQRYDNGYRDNGRGGYEDGRYEYARVVRVDPIIVSDAYTERTSERCYNRPSDGTTPATTATTAMTVVMAGPILPTVGLPA